MQNFRNLKVWQLGIDIVAKSYQLAKHLPKEEKYGIISQLSRAAVSIPSNIAEGSSRKSDKEFHYFLEIALGSAYEVETLLHVIEKLNLALSEVKELQEMVVEEQRMLHGLMKRTKL